MQVYINIYEPNLMTVKVSDRKTLFLDMDGVLADFDKGISLMRGRTFDRETEGNDPPEMWMPNFYKNLPVVPGAKEAVEELEKIKGLDIFIGSKPSTKPSSPQGSYIYCCPSEKYDWIGEHFPKYIKKIMLACDKGLLLGDYLVDDVERWLDKFQGTYLLFDPKNPKDSWKEVVEFMQKEFET